MKTHKGYGRTFPRHAEDESVLIECEARPVYPFEDARLVDDDWSNTTCLRCLLRRAVREAQSDTCD